MENDDRKLLDTHNRDAMSSRKVHESFINAYSKIGYFDRILEYQNHLPQVLKT